jgi:anti-sigma B factor antagonist
LEQEYADVPTPHLLAGMTERRPPATIVGRHGESATLRVAGEIDMTTTPALRGCLTDCLAEGFTHVTLDMTDMEFIDSSGLGVLVWALKELRARDGDLTILNPPSIAQKILGVSGLSPYLEIVSDTPSKGEEQR